MVEIRLIGTKLNPYSLGKEFQVDNTQVIINGELKVTVQDGSAPCIIENFVISKIIR